MPVARKKRTLSEIEEYAQYLESQGKRTPDEISEYTAYLMEKNGHNDPGAIMQGLQTVLQTRPAKFVVGALDYMGGGIRTALANAPLSLALRGAAGENLSLGKLKEDIGQALSGEAKTTGQFLERAGVPEGPMLSDILPSSYTGEGPLTIQRKGPLDLTARGAAGFAGDVATDPTTYVGAGAVARLGKLGKGLGKAGTVAKIITRPGASASKGIGKSLFKSAFKEADLKAARFKGMPSVSSIAEKYGISGTKKQVFDKTEKLLEALKEKRNAIIQQADDAGVKVSMREAFKPGQKAVDKWATGKNRIKQKFAKPLKKSIDEQVSLGEQTFKPVTVTRKKLPRERVFTEGREGFKYTVTPEVPDVIRRRTVSPASEGLVRKGTPAYETQPLRAAGDTTVAGATKGPVGVARAADPDVFKKIAPWVEEVRIPGTPEVTGGVRGVPERLRVGPQKIAEKRLPGRKYQPAPSMGELQDIKSSWQKSVSKSAWDKLGDSKAGAELGKKISTGIKEETERGAAQIGKKAELIEIHKEMGTLLNTIGVLDNEAAKAIKKKLFTEVDGALAMYNPAIFAGKQAGKVAGTSWFKTRLGKGLKTLSKGLDPYEQAQRRFLINLQKSQEEK